MQEDDRFFPQIPDPEVQMIVRDVAAYMATKKDWPLRAGALAVLSLGVTAAIARAHIDGEDVQDVKLEVLATADYLMDQFIIAWKRPKH